MHSNISKKISCIILTMLMVITTFGSVINAESTGVRGYVERLYTYVLGREGEDAGINSWVNAMNNGMPAAEVASGFFMSDEFKAKSYSTSDYLDVLYRSILGREADATGKADWTNQIENGLPRNQVLARFLESQEFTNLCNSYGVTRGRLVLTDLYDVHYREAQFAERAYRIILLREPDASGLRYWTERLSNGTNSAAEMIRGFFDSDEFRARNFSDSEYVEFLYQAVLNRASDASGKSYWVSMLTNDMVSRTYLLRGFIESNEFSNLASSYGITRGSIAVSEGRDRNVKANALIIGAYNAVFGRNPYVDEINHWGNMLYGGISCKTFMDALFATPDFTSKSKNDKVIAVYEAALGRTPSASEISSGVSLINASGIQAFIDSVINSQEFNSRCSETGVMAVFSQGLNNVGGRILYYENGSAYSGWKKINGSWYYFNPSNGNAAATGWTYVEGYKYFFNADGTLCQNVESMIGSQSSYYLTVNTSKNIVTIYAYDSATGSYCIPVKAMACSCGVAGSETIQGTYTTSRAGRWHPLMGNCYGQYCTNIHGNFLFHSAWYYESGNNRSLSVREYNRLGTNASHGCVRLCVADAKWIYENCINCRVTLSNSVFTPFDQPATRRAVVVSGDRGYDPTDPSI